MLVCHVHREGKNINIVSVSSLRPREESICFGCGVQGHFRCECLSAPPQSISQPAAKRQAVETQAAPAISRSSSSAQDIRIKNLKLQLELSEMKRAMDKKQQ